MATPTSHDSGHGHAAEQGHGDHGHGGTGVYLKVFLALCVLTTMSFFTYSDLWPFHDTPAVGWIFMLAVSCTKALLVMTFFMHLLWEANWKYVLTIPASLMSVFLVIALIPDVGQRVRTYSEERLLYSSDSVETVHGHEGAAGGEGEADEKKASGEGKSGDGESADRS